MRNFLSWLRGVWVTPPTPAPPRRVYRRGPCGICGRDMAITADGTTWTHRCVPPAPTTPTDMGGVA